MSLALFEFFWNWGQVSTPDSGAGGGSHGGGKGGSKGDDFSYVDWDDFWAVREAYLRSMNNDPIARGRAMTALANSPAEKIAVVPTLMPKLPEDAPYPDAILKPRRKRS
ncbi:MAG TPA: hypothetical protein VF443_01835 [Nitrospira sp.]